MCACTLYVHFAHSFCSTHNVGRIYCFICGYHHKALCSVFLTKFYQILGTEYIIKNSFYTVVLHQRNVFVRGCIDNDLWMISLKYFFKCFSVGDRTYFNLQIQTVSICYLQFLLNIICSVFIDIQNNDLFRIHFCQLSAEFWANGTAATCDQNNFSSIIFVCVLIRNSQWFSE